MKRLAPILAASLALAAPASAAPILYTCAFESARGGYWVAPEMAVAYDESVGRATVSDPIAQHFTGGPVQGRVVSDTPDALGIRWDLSRIRTDRQQFIAKLMYRLTIRKSDGRANVSVTPAGYANAFRAPGRCRLAG